MDNEVKLKWWQYVLMFAVMGAAKGGVESYFKIKERKRQEAINRQIDEMTCKLQHEFEADLKKRAEEAFGSYPRITSDEDLRKFLED